MARKPRSSTPARRAKAAPDVTALRQEAKKLAASLFEAEVSRERLSDLFHFAPAGFVSLGARGTVLDLNYRASTFLGRASRTLVGLPFAVCLERSCVQRFLDHLRQCRDDPGPVTSDLEIRRPQGPPSPVRLLSTRLPGRRPSSPGPYLTVLLDLTEQRGVESALEERNAHLRLALRHAHAGVWSIELRSRQILWSPEFFALLGLDAAAVTPSEAAFFEVLHPDDRGAAERALQPVLAGERDEFRGDYRVRLAAGGLRWLRMWGSSTRGNQWQPSRITGIGIDVTEQKQAEALLSKSRASLEQRVKTRTASLEAMTATLRQEITDRRVLEQQILEISERERRRIGQDLHDGLGQQLTGILFHAHLLHKHLAAKGAPEAQEAAQLASLLDEAKVQARQVARGLQPVEPSPNGLMAGLDHFARNACQLYRLRCRVVCPEPVLIEDYTTSTHLFRIAQEAVANAFRHGGARHIEIRLQRTGDGKIELEVADDGCGLPKPRRRTQGLGLRFMQYRAEAMGGTFEVRPRPGGGTIVCCRVPGNTGSNIAPPPPSFSFFPDGTAENGAET